MCSMYTLLSRTLPSKARLRLDKNLRTVGSSATKASEHHAGFSDFKMIEEGRNNGVMLNFIC